MKVTLTETQLKNIIKKSLMEAIPRDDNYQRARDWMRNMTYGPGARENEDREIAKNYYDENISDVNIPEDVIIDAFVAGMDYVRNN